MNNSKTTRAEALLWSLIIAVIITGAIHAAATTLPDWFSARNTKQSAAESAAARFSEYWLTNALWLGGVVVLISFAIVFALMSWRLKSSSRPGSGAV